MTTPPTNEPPARTSRAGRNLSAAIASGVVLGALVLVTLFTWKWLFAILATAVLAIAVAELSSAFARKNIGTNRFFVILCVVAVSASACVYGTTGLLAAMGVAILAAFAWRLRGGPDGFVRDLCATIFLLVYVAFMAGFVMLILSADNGPQRIITFILLTISNDIGGYAVGVLFGRHPIAPTLSPKKSWEGLAGSLVVQMVVGAAAFHWLLQAPMWMGVIMGVVMSITATMGDFAESAIKRDLGVKDLGTALPGHGGIMDRVDSLIPNAFVAWALFALFLGTA